MQRISFFFNCNVVNGAGHVFICQLLDRWRFVIGARQKYVEGVVMGKIARYLKAIKLLLRFLQKKRCHSKKCF